MVPKTSPGDARVLILAWTDGLGRATAEYVGLAALFPFSVRFSLIYRERASRTRDDLMSQRLEPTSRSISY